MAWMRQVVIMDGINDKGIAPLLVRACCNTATRAVVQTDGRAKERVATQVLELTMDNYEFVNIFVDVMPYDLASSTCIRT